jgi:hypothetical protein
MKETEGALSAARDEAVAAGRAHPVALGETSRNDLDWHRAETERLRVLIEFLARPVHAPGGTETDPDVLAAYNLAVEAALKGIRRAAAGRTPPSPA